MKQILILLVLAITILEAKAQTLEVTDARIKEFGSSQLHYIANTRPPDAYVSLRTQPSSTSGQRITTMPNGTTVKVLQKRADGWWQVQIVLSGKQGWALSGKDGRVWIECCQDSSVQSANSQAPSPKEAAQPANSASVAPRTTSKDAVTFSSNEMAIISQIQATTECFSIGQDYTLAGTPLHNGPSVMILPKPDSVRDDIFLDPSFTTKMLTSLKQSARIHCEGLLRSQGQLNPSIEGFAGATRVPNGYVVKFVKVSDGFIAYSDGADNKWVIVKNEIPKRIEHQRAQIRAQEDARRAVLEKEQREAASLEATATAIKSQPTIPDPWGSPSTKVAEAAFIAITQQNWGGSFDLIFFKKTDGLDQNINGQPVYQFSFAAQIEFPNGRNLQCAPLPGGGLDTRPCGMTPYSAPGSRKLFTDTITFLKSERGWVAQSKWLRYR